MENSKTDPSLSDDAGHFAHRAPLAYDSQDSEPERAVARTPARKRYNQKKKKKKSRRESSRMSCDRDDMSPSRGLFTEDMTNFIAAENARSGGNGVGRRQEIEGPKPTFLASMGKLLRFFSRDS